MRGGSQRLRLGNLLAATLACACASGLDETTHCSDVTTEATGIEWESLSGYIGYSHWEFETRPYKSRGCLYLIDVPARQVRLLRDVATVPDQAGGPVGWSRELSFRPDRSTLTFSVQDMTGHWQLRDLSLATKQETALFTDPTAHHAYPIWSPDGRLSFYSNGLLSNDIYIDGRVAVLKHPLVSDPFHNRPKTSRKRLCAVTNSANFARSSLSFSGFIAGMHS